MQSGIQTKIRLTFLTLIAVAFAGVLSACGGGSGEAEGVDGIKKDNSAIIPSTNQLNKYVGTYWEDKCWTNVPTADIYSGITSQLLLSASGKPNTLKVAYVHYFYKGNHGIECTVEIGSSTSFGELTYAGTLPSVEFIDSTKQSLKADKFQVNYTSVVNKGVVSERWDELSDYESFKGLLAQDGNKIYFADYDSPLDAEGFPTRLDENNFNIRK
jgi:hypothetical protein